MTHKCEECRDTGWINDSGPGIGGREYARCNCGNRSTYSGTAENERDRLRARVKVLTNRIAERDARIIELEEDRPYWLWRGLLEWESEHVCDKEINGINVPECSESDDCITEWCIPCAASEYLGRIKERESR